MQKKNKFQIQIPKPCHEKWSEMTPNEKGRHCDQCAKTIVDFSQVSDNELAQLFIQKKGKICGRFNTTQLNRDIRIPMPAKPSRNVAAVGLLLTSLLGATNVASQTTPIEQMEIRHTIGKIAIPETVNEEPIEKTFVEGIVTDAETGEVLGVANVYLKNHPIGTVTDFDGKYKLEIPNSLKNKQITLVFSYAGLIIQEILLDQIDKQVINIDIALLSSLMLMGEMICISYPEEETLWKKLKNLVHHLKEKRVDKKLEKLNRKKEKEIVIAPEELTPIQIAENSTIEIHYSIQAKVYPNPFVQNLSLALNSEKEQVVLLRIFSIDGKEVFAKEEELYKGINEIQLDLNTQSLTNGNYLLQLIDADGLIQQFPLVKVNRL